MATVTCPGDIPPDTAPYFSGPYFSEAQSSARTLIPDLIASVESAGSPWDWFTAQGVSPATLLGWSEHIEASCAKISAASVT